VRRYQRRLLLAIACSIAIHEIVIGAGGFLRMERDPVAKDVPATRIVLEVRTPAPTPTPRPRSTPAIVVSVAAPRATTVAVHTGGSKGGPKLEVHTQKTVHHKESLPIWYAAMHGSKKVASMGTGTVPASAPGASGIEGNGNGSGSGSENGAGGGTGGSGSGVANTTTPCGSPIFYRIHAQYNPKDGSFDDTIRVRLILGDGQKLEGVFPYTWHYASEADDPFSQPPSKDNDEGVHAQLPAEGFDVSKESTAVRLTLAKTLPDGRTRFDPCPPGVGDDL
jgi:hypothetical protein